MEVGIIYPRLANHDVSVYISVNLFDYNDLCSSHGDIEIKLGNYSHKQKQEFD